MTRDEFFAAQEAMIAFWPHSRRAPRGEHFEAVFMLWQGLEYGEAVDALRALAAEGREHAPPPGAVVRKVAEMRGAGGEGGFDDVWDCLRAANRLGAFRHPRDELARRRLEAAHRPEVVAFAERHYRDYAMSGGADGDPVGVVRAQLRALWEQGQVSRRDGAAFELAGMPRLRRADRPELPGGDAA